MCEWNGVARWESCLSGVSWQGEKGKSIVRRHGQRGGKVMRGQFGKGGG